MWEVGKQKLPPPKNFHKKLFEDTKGHLSEAEARRWIVNFFKTNIYDAALHIGGVKLFPFQEIVIKSMIQKDYTLGILSRGIGKSWSTGVYAFLEAIFTPNCKIAILSKTFRQSRQIFQNIEDIASKADASLLAECFAGKPSHSNDEWSMKFDNGSVIKALPLGDGQKLRGFRFNVLIIDELLLMPEKVLNEVIMPFLSTNANVDVRSELMETCEEAVKKGIITQEDYSNLQKEHPLFKNNKMIGLSSASYQFENLYKIFCDYKTKILSGTKDGKPLLKDGSNHLEGSYSVFQFAYDIAPKGLYNTALIEKAKTEMSRAQFAREFGSQFTDDSAGFFSVSTMESCTYPFGERPTIEIKGEEGADYIVSIDPNASESDNADFFAITIFKKMGEKWVQVHTYGIAGVKYSDHIKYFYYLLTNFKVKFIVMDNAGGIQFLRACEESKIFQDAKIKFGILSNNDVDFLEQEPEKYKSQCRKAKRLINQIDGYPVYFQKFTPEWIRRSNEYLQLCIDKRKIRWGSDISGIDSLFNSAQKYNIGIEKIKFTGEENVDIYGKVIADDYEKFSDKKALLAKQIDFIEHQQFLINLTKRQIGSIEPKTTDGGTMQFNLPQSLRKQDGPNRARRDLYTVVLMCNWIVRIWDDIQSTSLEIQEDWEPEMF